MSLKTSSARLAHSNYVFGDGVVSLTVVPFTGGALFNESNLSTPQLSDRVTVISPGSIQIFLELPEDRPIGVIGLLNVDIAHSETWIVQVLDSDDVAVFSSGVQQLILAPADGFDRHHWVILPAEVMGNRVQISFFYTDTTLVFSAGALWVSRLWMTERGIQDGWSIYPIPRGSNPISDDGQGYPARKHTVRAIDCTLARFSRAEAFGTSGAAAFDVQRIQHTVDVTEFVVFWPRIALNGVLDPHLIHRLGVYGVFKELGKITHIPGSPDEFTCGPWTIEGRR